MRKGIERKKKGVMIIIIIIQYHATCIQWEKGNIERRPQVTFIESRATKRGSCNFSIHKKMHDDFEKKERDGWMKWRGKGGGKNASLKLRGRCPQQFIHTLVWILLIRGTRDDNFFFFVFVTFKVNVKAVPVL